MIMDSKGKLFGKVSIIDITIIIMVIILCAGVYVRLTGTTGKAIAAGEDFYYTFKIDNIRKPAAEALQKSIGHRFSLNEKQQSEMGELLSAEVNQAYGIIEKADGTVVSAEIPERFDVILTLKLQGKVNTGGYFTPQLREINAGSAYVIKSKYCTAFGTVQKVWQ